MTVDEMFNELDGKARDTYIVTLKYKYDFEENYIIENHILEYDCFDDSYVWLNDWYEGQTNVEVLGYMPLNGVDTIISLRPKGKWIPVSERLPEEPGYYLVTIKIEIIPALKPYYEVCSAKFGCSGTVYGFDIGYIGDGVSVIAWMPLPEPYKAESEEEGWD